MNHVEEILKRAVDIHIKKRADYASNPNTDPFENFDRSNLIASWFPPAYASFAVLIGTKLARLGSLLVTGKKPKNESIDDSFLDLVTYCALFYGYWKARQEKAEKNKHCYQHKYYVVGCIPCELLND
jgi:hypothetical protein